MEALKTLLVFLECIKVISSMLRWKGSKNGKSNIKAPLKDQGAHFHLLNTFKIDSASFYSKSS